MVWLKFNIALNIVDKGLSRYRIDTSHDLVGLSTLVCGWIELHLPLTAAATVAVADLYATINNWQKHDCNMRCIKQSASCP